jgi:hypothetical protein
MSRTAKLGTVAAGLILLNLLVVALDSSKANAAPNDPPKPVYVTNTPLPVSGSLTIGSLPSVTIANTPLSVSGTVGISGPVNFSTSSPLTVTNALDSSSKPIPLVVSEPAIVPYQSSCTVGLALTCEFSAVPPGKRLVIQEFDAIAVVNSGSLTSTQLDVPVNGTSVFHSFTVVNNGGNTYVTNQSTTLYADPGSTPLCSINTNGSIPAGSTPACAISGYLVPAQ